MSLSDNYTGLIIKQYYDKPKAKAEITLKASYWQAIFDCIKSFDSQFDLDTAVGVQLDMLGKLVGIARRVPFSGELLDDTDYRFFIKLKIANNVVRATMASSDGISLQAAINQAFDGKAYVTDNKDMSLTLTVSSTFDLSRLELIENLKLLPKPQGVRYNQTMIGEVDSFGFADNLNAKGFGEVGNPGIGGTFAEILIF